MLCVLLLSAATRVHAQTRPSLLTDYGDEPSVYALEADFGYHF